ncbi:unnamed protein product [Dicrocoelium dendriticum]|nr:unnamed protein product [Dicrocoelium dendriticum]
MVQQPRKTEVKGWIRKKCIISKRLDDKVAVITGANSGIGKVVTTEMARRGCTVVMGCRSMERAATTKNAILTDYGDSNPNSTKINVADDVVASSLSPIRPEQLILEQLDLASLKSVREFAERVASAYPKVDFLINNAGLILAHYEQTDDGFEKTIGVNHLGHFLLTDLLLGNIKRAAPSRIIIVSSTFHYQGKLCRPDLQMKKDEYNGQTAYKHSKLMNVMHGLELSDRLEGTGVTVLSVHPGHIRTEIFRDFSTINQMLAGTWISSVFGSINQ